MTYNFNNNAPPLFREIEENIRDQNHLYNPLKNQQFSKLIINNILENP